MRLLHLLAVTLFCAAIASTAHAQTEVDIATAKRLAVVLIAKGQPRAAHEVLSALLQRNSKDPEILISMSRAERQMGAFSQAAASGRAAFRYATNPTLKYIAARVTAEALASNNQHTMAQIWLRRAGQNAPDAQAKTSIQRDYSYVRSRNPWSFNFDGSIAPTDNANDAPTSDEIVIGGLIFLDPTARPIPGLELNFSAMASYRLPATETRQTQFSLAYDARRVQLGSEAATIDPDLKDSDFAFDRVTFGWAGKFRRTQGTGVFDLSSNLFLDWNGGARSQNGQAIAAGYTFPVADQQWLRFGGSLENLDRVDNPLRSSTTLRLSAGWNARLQNRDAVGVRLTLSETESASLAVAHHSSRLRAYYTLADPVMSAKISFAADLRGTLFDEPLYSAERRKDTAVAISASATFSDWGRLGFAPVVELRNERVRSNVARFDTRSTQLSLSIRSTY